MPAVPTASSKSRMVSRLAREIFNRVLTDKQRKTVNPDYKAASKKKSGGRDKNRRNRRNKNNRNNKLLSGKGKLAPLAKPGGIKEGRRTPGRRRAWRPGGRAGVCRAVSGASRVPGGGGHTRGVGR